MNSNVGEQRYIDIDLNANQPINGEKSLKFQTSLLTELELFLMFNMNKLKNYFNESSFKAGSWMQFFNRKQFSIPLNILEVSNRFSNNLQVYFSNYIFITMILLVYSLLTSPLLLTTLAIYSGLIHSIIKRDSEVIFFGAPLSRNQQLVGASAFFIPLLYLFGLATKIIWVKKLFINLLI